MLILVLVLGIYLGVKPSLYIDNLVLLLPQKRRERAHEIIWKMGHALRFWLLGRFIVMISMSILTIVGLYVIGMPLPFALGIITGAPGFCSLPWGFCRICTGIFSCPIRIFYNGDLCIYYIPCSP